MVINLLVCLQVLTSLEANWWVVVQLVEEKPTKYLVAIFGNHQRNRRNGLLLPILWWQFMKRTSRVICFGKY